MNLTRQDRETILRKVSELVTKKHFNPGLNGADWPAILEVRRTRILDSEGAEEFEKEVHDLVSQLKTSHTGFFHRSARNMPARLAVNATVRRLTINGDERWVFEDIHEGGAAQKAGVEPGDILLGVDDAQLKPPAPLVFKMGKSAKVTLRKRDGKETIVTFDVPFPRDKKHPVAQPKPVSFLKTEKGVGLLKVTMFPGIVGIDVAHDIDHAIAQLQGCERLIIDLRGNTGGGIGGLRLMSYLTPGKIPVGYSLTKRRATNGYRKERLPSFGRIPDSQWMLPLLALRYAFGDKSIVVISEGLGPQRFHGRIVLLVNQHSASAAEMVAGFAVENKLATIVGARTAGRLLSGGAFKVGHGYLLGLPVAAYLTWQGTMLEGKGITPDVPVDFSYESFKEGRDNQLEKAIEIVEAL